MHVLIAPQELKGTLSAREAAEALARGVSAARPGWRLDLTPIADGGPGTLDALLADGGRRLERTVEDPLGQSVTAAFGVRPDGTGVVEMAQASGLWRVTPSPGTVRRASTRGTGQLLRAALEEGCTEVWIGAGGSATHDGGAGALEVLGFRFLDDAGRPLPPGGAALGRLARIDASDVMPAARTARLRVLTDVRNPLLGPDGATRVYAAQKGADEETLEALERALTRFADIVERTAGRTVRNVPGAGAAGGLAFGLAALLGAELVPGFDEVARAIDLDARIARADVVLTGEGRLDRQTKFGKGPQAIADRAHRQGRPVIAFVGRRTADAAVTAFEEVIETSPAGAPPSSAEAAAAMEVAAFRWAAHIAPRSP